MFQIGNAIIQFSSFYYIIKIAEILLYFVYILEIKDI